MNNIELTEDDIIFLKTCLSYFQQYADPNDRAIQHHIMRLNTKLINAQINLQPNLHVDRVLPTGE